MRERCSGAFEMSRVARCHPSQREIRFKINRIAMAITELLPRVGVLGVGSPDQYVLVRCATDYLPTAFQGYLDLPRDYADHCVVADGKTPLALLSEQLDLLTTEINRIADRVNGIHSDKLIANGRFLGQKFGPGALDLDAGRKGTENDVTTAPGKRSKEDRHENTKLQLVSALTEPWTSTAFASMPVPSRTTANGSSPKSLRHCDESACSSSSSRSASRPSSLC